MKKIRNIVKCKRGEGYIDVCIIVLVFVMIMALMLAAVPVFVAKIQLDNFADELVREAEIAGQIGSETTARAAVLSEKTGLSADVISKILRSERKMTAEEFLAICDALDINPNEFRATA